jgi:hypothetical protein
LNNFGRWRKLRAVRHAYAPQKVCPPARPALVSQDGLAPCVLYPTTMEGNRVKHLIAASLAVLLSAAASSAMAVSFRAAAEGKTVVVYVTSDKDENCFTEVRFSYLSGDKRVVRRYVCHIMGRAGTDVRFCERTDDDFVDLQIESPVTFNCQ